VDITWICMANLYYELGPLRVLTDGYITRIPRDAFYGGGGGLAYTRQPFTPDVEAVRRVLDLLGGPSGVDLILSGHSHFDHSFDTATWCRLTGAPIIGPRTTCFQAMAEGILPDRCTPVYGGEVISLAEGVRMHVVRWNHGGSPAECPEQHNPVELDAAPRPDPLSGGLRPGVAEDFPNGGGSRGFLFVVDGAAGRFSWFYENSASASQLGVPIVVDGVDYGAPLLNLEAALQAAGLDVVDLWVGFSDLPLAELVLPVLRPRAFLPIHWDDTFGAFLAGVQQPYSDPPLERFLSECGVRIFKPQQYMDKWRLDPNGLQPLPNAAVKSKLGF